ncbi:MAG: hypothetical protein CL879_03400 [Dehalococcoidia bacterium]|nr:hypothetical protein [Dehalococcoidia bacterium]
MTRISDSEIRLPLKSLVNADLSSNAAITEIDNEPIFECCSNSYSMISEPIFWVYFLIKMEVSAYIMVMIIENQ